MDNYSATTLNERYMLQDKFSIIFNSYSIIEIDRLSKDEMLYDVINSIVLNITLTIDTKSQLLLLIIPDLNRLMEILLDLFDSDCLQFNQYLEIIDYIGQIQYSMFFA